jgi:predicted transcriptional regulator YheO
MHKKLIEYRILVDFLKEMFGPSYEIVLHDIHGGEGEIIAIANGHITGRKVGDPLTTFASNTIASKEYRTKDYVMNYHAKSKQGTLLRSSSLFIKDEGRLIGLLCINFDDSKFSDLTDQLRSLIHPDEVLFNRLKIEEKEEPIEYISESISDVTKQTLIDYFLKINIHLNQLNENQQKTFVKQLSQDIRMEIIKELNDRGIFLVKGAISEVARELYCSEPTIYRYLNKLK